jgi:chloramphenicol O-acetyltransferase
MGIFIFQMKYQTLSFTLIFIFVASRIALAVQEIRGRMENEGEVLVDEDHPSTVKWLFLNHQLKS